MLLNALVLVLFQCVILISMTGTGTSPQAELAGVHLKWWVQVPPPTLTVSLFILYNSTFKMDFNLMFCSKIPPVFIFSHFKMLPDCVSVILKC